jgi:Winged helix DNA-binding domain
MLNQRLTRPGPRTVDEVVRWFGAVQAQEYAMAKWALALRMRGTVTSDAIERAIDAGKIIRTHVLRPTWHFVAADDIGWMLRVTAPRVHAKLAYAYRFYKVDAVTRGRAADVFARALERGDHLTRGELGEHLGRAGLPAKGVPLAMLTIHAELEGVMCSGPRRGKELTYARLSARVSNPSLLSGDDALTELTRRYFRSHAPATIRDFVWWSGLTMADAKRGLDMIGAQREVVDGLTYWRVGRVDVGAARRRAESDSTVRLVPIYDEYLVAYRDLAAVPRAGGDVRGSLGPAVIIDGQVAGSWKPTISGDDVIVTVNAHRRFTRSERDAVEGAVARFGRHLQKRASTIVKT